MTRSIQQLPNNTTTAQTQSVYTQTGFNAGDAVYYQNGDYVSPTVTPSAFANPTGSLAFIPSTTGPYTTSGGIDSNIGGISPVLTGTNASGYGFLGGARGVSTAILSNGNIVNVWIQHTRMVGAGPSRPYFQVTTAAGVQVVAPTAISTTLLAVDHSMITVTALPSGSGGGFVVAWVNTTGGTATRPNYAIYTNAGGVTLAAFNDTTWGTTTNQSNYLSATAMPNGSTFLYWRNSTLVGFYKIIGPTGTVIAAWSSSGITGQVGSSSMGIAVRSTNEILVVDCTSSTQFSYRIFTSTGAAVIATQVVTMTGTRNVNSYASYATCLADGTTFYFTIIGSGPSSSAAGISYYSLPTGNTLSAEASIPQANLNTTQTNSNLPQVGGIYGLASGGFVLAFCDAANFLRYVVFNSAGVVQSGTNANGALPLGFPNSFISNFTTVGINETSGFINFYWSVITVAANQPANIFRAQISNSTYLPTYLSTGTTTLPSTNLSGPSTVNMASSTLTNIKYNLVSNTTTTALVPLTTAVTTPTALTSFACSDVFSATLTNGKLAVAYIRTSNTTLYVNIYSIAGVFEQTITVGVVTTNCGIRLAALTSGKFVVAYASSSVDVSVTVYSTSYTVVYTSPVITSDTSLGSANNFDMAALTNDQYVIVIGRNSAGSIASFMFSGASATQIATYTLTSAGGQGAFTSWGQYVQVRGNNYGGFIVNGKNNTSSSGVAQWYLQTSATAWNFAYSSNTASSAGTFWSYQGCAYSGSGTYLVLADNSSSNTQYYAYVFVDGGTNGQRLNVMGTMTNPGSAYTTAVGNNGLGTFVQVDQAASVPTTYLFGMPGCGTLDNGSLAGTQSFMVVPGAGSSTLTGQGSATSSRVTISPGVGNNAYLVYLQNTTNFPVVTTVATFPTNVTSTVPNSQVSTNAAVPINPIATSSSTTIPNTILSGVAANTVPANSTGQLIINGLAQLNTSYPAVSNQAFDTTGLAIDGVKGTVKNRVVNMQGNS
jgi:hypothetical protein